MISTCIVLIQPTNRLHELFTLLLTFLVSSASNTFSASKTALRWKAWRATMLDLCLPSRFLLSLACYLVSACALKAALSYASRILLTVLGRLPLCPGCSQDFLMWCSSHAIANILVHPKKNNLDGAALPLLLFPAIRASTNTCSNMCLRMFSLSLH